MRFAGGGTLTTIRTIPTHEVVRRTYPRPAPTESDAVAMAVGSTIDRTLSEFGHAVRLGRRPGLAGLATRAEAVLDEALAEAAVSISADMRARFRTEIAGTLDAYRRSPIYGLARPRTRVVVIGGEVGVYAQPDYWDGSHRFFEMKSYDAIPPSPEVLLQLRLFQLAFPGFEAVLVCIDRHRRPVATTVMTVPAAAPAEAESTLRLAYDLGHAFGQEKVLEYMEGPFVHYARPPTVPPPARGPGNPTETGREPKSS